MTFSLVDVLWRVFSPLCSVHFSIFSLSLSRVRYWFHFLGFFHRCGQFSSAPVFLMCLFLWHVQRDNPICATRMRLLYVLFAGIFDFLNHCILYTWANYSRLLEGVCFAGCFDSFGHNVFDSFDHCVFPYLCSSYFKLFGCVFFVGCLDSFDGWILYSWTLNILNFSNWICFFCEMIESFDHCVSTCFELLRYVCLAGRFDSFDHSVLYTWVWVIVTCFDMSVLLDILVLSTSTVLCLLTTQGCILEFQLFSIDWICLFWMLKLQLTTADWYELQLFWIAWMWVFCPMFLNTAG